MSDVSDWLFAQPAFSGLAREKGVRFIGLCNQTLYKTGKVVNGKGEEFQAAKSIGLKLPDASPTVELNVRLESVPDEADPEDPLLLKIKAIAERSWYYDNLTLFTVEFGLTESLLDFIHSELPPFIRDRIERDGEESRLWPYFVALGDYGNYIARHIAVYSNICKAGSFVLLEGFVFVGEKQVTETRPYYSPLSQIAQIEADRGIRLLRELDFKKNWDFYAGLGGTFCGSPKTPIEIAVGNLADLFDENFDHSGARNLIWSFAGLEGLLADSESSIGSQLRQKLVALFGNQVDVGDFEKSISSIYKYRSNVIHGNIKEGTVLRNQGSKFFAPSKENGETKTAMWLLLSVLQYCFQNRLSEIRFKTVVV